MPTRDLRSNIESVLAFNAAISTNTTTDGAIIDTAHYDSGVMFAFICSFYDSGTFTVNLQEGDESDLSDATDIADNNIIGNKADISITATTADGAVLQTLGITCTKRYVRAQVISVGTTGESQFEVVCNRKAELLPVIEPDVS